MEKVEGQCYNCYSDSMFQYFGQTGAFSESENRENYFKAITKPVTVNCVTCGKEVAYTDKE